MLLSHRTPASESLLSNSIQSGHTDTHTTYTRTHHTYIRTHARTCRCQGQSCTYNLNCQYARSLCLSVLVVLRAFLCFCVVSGWHSFRFCFSLLYRLTRVWYTSQCKNCTAGRFGSACTGSHNTHKHNHSRHMHIHVHTHTQTVPEAQQTRATCSAAQARARRE